MKKIFLITIILISLVSSCSEEKDFLTKDPLDKITDLSLSYTASECKLYVNKFYTSFWGTGASYIYHYDLGSDNLLSVDYNNNPDLIDGLRVVPSSGGGWSTNEWGNIRSVNFLLDNYTKSKEPDKVEKYIGEARFFRAFFYFERFLKNFGGVPWIETQLSLNSEELTAPRLKRHELANKIIADLDLAISKIPSFTVQEKGRISKEVAMLYKARIALYEASWEKYHTGTVFAGEGNPTNYFKIARDAANSVIASGFFSLDNVGVKDGYHKLFNQLDYSSSKEVLLWVKFDRALGLSHGNTNKHPALDGAGVGLTRWLVESYLCTDGKPIHNSDFYKGDGNLLTIIQNRDPRLEQTMFTPGRARRIEKGDTTLIFTKSSINLSTSEKCSTGYELAKGMNPNADEQLSEIGTNKASIVFRYAEALLIYAESKAELGEITQTDLDVTINALRDRVDMPHLKVDVGFIDTFGDFTATRGYQGLPVSNLLQEIRRERRIELACEGYRLDDLKRWRAHHLWNHDLIQGAKTSQFKDLKWVIDYFTLVSVPKGVGDSHTFMSEIVAKWKPDCVEGGNYWTDNEGYFAPYQRFIPSGHFTFNPDKSYLLPIPSEQLILNTNLVQNPGWPNK
jgi:hypothetical protein